MVTELFTKEQKQLRLIICKDLLSLIETGGDAIGWETIITGDETWVF